MTVAVRRNRAPAQWGGAWPSRPADPFTEFQHLWDQMGRLFEQSAETDTTAWRPTAETEETADAYVIRTELPGLRRDDVRVEIDGNELRVSGKIDQDEKVNALRRRTGKFVFRMILPNDADTDRISGELANGVLAVRVPKTEQGPSRRIEIRG